MATDLITASHAHSESDDPNVAITKMMVGASEILADNDPIDIIGRAIQLWLPSADAAPTAVGTNSISFADEFRSKNQMGMADFLHMLYMLAHSPTSAEPGNPPWSPFVIDDRSFFAKSRFTEEMARQALTILSHPLTTVTAELIDREAGRHGYALAGLERNPLIKVGDHAYLLYDRNLLLRYFTSGIWWNIHDGLPEARREKFRTYFGDVFEAYINRVIQHGCGSSPLMQYFADPRFNKSAQICDGIVETSTAWVAIETKAALLKHKSKYSAEPGVLHDDILARFSGTEAEPKAARQLARSIRTLVVDGKRDSARRLAAHAPRAVYPVVVSFDRVVCNKQIASFLEPRFRDELVVCLINEWTFRPRVGYTHDYAKTTCSSRRRFRRRPPETNPLHACPR